MQFLVIGFDGLRSDLVTEENMPNLWALQSFGTRMARHRPVFPSETVVNLSSLVTGTRPTNHGIMGNSFMDPMLTRNHLFNGFEVGHIEMANRVYPTGLFTTPSMGELLGDAGKRMAVISTLYPGIARIKHHQISKYSHQSFCCYNFDSSWPPSFARTTVDRLGPPPIRKVPDKKVINYATDAFFELVVQTGLPDVTYLWFVEPDDSCHAFGLGSEEVRTALRLVDKQLGRILDWRDSSIYRDTLQIIVTSDHGQVTQSKPWSIHEFLENSGFRISSNFDENCDCSIAAGYHGSIHIARKDAGLRQAIAQALMSTDEVGLIFTNADSKYDGEIVDGTIPTEFVGLNHKRAPDINYVLRTSNSSNKNGYIGECVYDVAQGIPLGGTIHGGLHPAELSAYCLLAGTAMNHSKISDTPSGIVDIAATIISTLGIKAPITMDGRILTEAFSNGEIPQHEVKSDSLTASWEGYQQTVERLIFGNSIYMNGGARDA